MICPAQHPPLTRADLRGFFGPRLRCAPALGQEVKLSDYYQQQLQPGPEGMLDPEAARWIAALHPAASRGVGGGIRTRAPRERAAVRPDWRT